MNYSTIYRCLIHTKKEQILKTYKNAKIPIRNAKNYIYKSYIIAKITNNELKY